ncbi:hypothetical protein [Xanthomonas sp. XNM01]|uniref:hypothetical protein n=1 Tax=Xanthomonas sp. XNM01 TaxID=2769289 RepID=UPI001782E113|nr:hypothetical protein [Xanthomonas sp. XNM01]MBD9368864.1 hypothetical protein [Xanthomonas sp. XNM01]
MTRLFRVIYAGLHILLGCMMLELVRGAIAFAYPVTTQLVPDLARGVYLAITVFWGSWGWDVCKSINDCDDLFGALLVTTFPGSMLVSIAFATMIFYVPWMPRAGDQPHLAINLALIGTALFLMTWHHAIRAERRCQAPERGQTTGRA